MKLIRKLICRWKGHLRGIQINSEYCDDKTVICSFQCPRCLRVKTYKRKAF